MLANTSPYPLNLEINSAKGSFLYDKNGKAYLDFISGVGVSNLGHGIESISKAVEKQLNSHSHIMVYGEYQQPIVRDFAQTLSEFLPTSLEAIYPVNSGTEANEAAIKLCRRFTGRSEIVSFKGAYHGNTTGSMSISYNEHKKQSFRPLMPGTSFMELNVSEHLNQITAKTAGVFLETIQGDAGVRIPDKEFMLQLRQKCSEVGALLILDEIQCGYGRTGKFSAFEHYHIEPDILSLGKALGAGLPIGALAASQAILKTFETQPNLGHITTFGGNPVVAAAANAGLKYFKNHIDLEEVERKGKKIKSLLQVHPRIKEIRQMGLMLGIDLESEELNSKLIHWCQKQGVLIFWFLSVPNAFRISPPLNISDEELEFGCETILKGLEEL